MGKLYYSIKIKYYEVFIKIILNLNEATILHTDCNITSSNIITTDRITTMRSYLYLAKNVFDALLI